MRVRSFPVSFEQVVGEQGKELQFGPEDQLQVQPLFGLPAEEVQGLLDRMSALKDDDSSSEAAGQVIVDLLRLTVTRWSLTWEDGTQVPMPRTTQELDKLPLVLRGGLFSFLMSFRGRDANPTTPA